MTHSPVRICCLAILALIGCTLATRAAEPAEVQFRVRVKQVTPAVPCRIHWRWGGEGLGGDVVSGEVTAILPAAPDVADGPDAAFGDGDEGMTLEVAKGPDDRIIVEGETYNYHYLKPGVWSHWTPVSTFKTKRGGFITFTIEGHGEPGKLLDGILEFEFRQGKTVVKRFEVAGPDGPTFGTRIPLARLLAGDASPEAMAGVGSLHDYVDYKLETIRALPGMDRPVPKLYGILTDCAGYGYVGYKTRTADRATMLAEYELLHTLGFNGLRGCEAFFAEMIAKREGIGADFGRILEGHTIGYPISTIKRADGRKPDRAPGDGCPYYPGNMDTVKTRATEAAATMLAAGKARGVHSAWGLTVDEIGPVFNSTPEGKAHLGSCQYCNEAFREMIKAEGRTLAEFGATSWDDIRPVYGYWSYDYWESHRMRKEEVVAAKAAMAAAADAAAEQAATDIGTGGEGVDLQLDAAPKTAIDPATRLAQAEAALDDLEWTGRVMEVPKEQQVLKVSETGWRLLTYYSRRFNGESSARLFTPVREAYAAQNARKQAALDRGETDTPEATQPWVYSFALRGNTFLMGGASLGFFDFYKYADNAMVYETSNRDSRVWQWDSYLCDVGRSNRRFRGTEFGIYVKPHRGASTQRALASVARGVRLLFWYTYGPEWSKGDTYGGNLEILEDIAMANRLVAAAEPVSYESEWAVPPRIAVVRPRTAEFLSGNESWENGKWVYTALQHAHLPVDALDEDLLLELDLSPYTAIVISGRHIRKDVALKLKDWVKAGGTLYTSGGGMARDEADNPLTVMHEVFGVSDRQELELWGDLKRYGATKLAGVKMSEEAPANATATGLGVLEGSHRPSVGREVFLPLDKADVMATWADGSAAALRHSYGQGTAWVIGTFAGIEYATDAMSDRHSDYPADRRTWIAGPLLAAGIQPTVDADSPRVEGILLRNKTDAGKLAAILINWGTPVTEMSQVRLRGVSHKATIRSAALQQELTVIQGEDGLISVLLPSLDQGDVLLIDE